MGIKRYSEALAVSRRALELDPTHKEAAFNYGTCELYAGDPERALALIGPLARQNPDYPLLQALLAVLFMANGRVEDAARCVAKLKSMHYDIDSYLAARLHTLASLPDRGNVADRIRRAATIPGG